MSFILAPSPHSHQAGSTARIMQWVLLACLPGLAAQTFLFGWGNLVNVIWCMTLAVASEALILGLRGRAIGPRLRDGSALVTGLLLGLSLPPLAPWWLSLVAVVAAIVLAKQLYGGLGQNPFNPAMVGYALVLVSFPVAMTVNWANPDHSPGLVASFLEIFGGGQEAPDGWTQATPLDIYKHRVDALTATEIREHPSFGGTFAGGWEWINLAFLAGGLGLLALRIVTWHIPLAFLASLFLCALTFGWDPDQNVPPRLHLLAGGTLLAATSRQGKLIYGAGIGILVYVIRTWGSYPDAIAFAVLLMNFAAPFIDYYTRPRVYGQDKPRRRLS